MLQTRPSTSEDVDAGGHPIPHRWWFTPAFFILLPVTMSFIAWSAMVGWRTFGETTTSWAKLSGFSDPSAVNAGGLVLLIVWYSAVVTIATLGWRLGMNKRPKKKTIERISSLTFERRYFILINWVAFIGVIYSYYKINSAQSILDSLTTQDNQFTNSLPGNAGIQTLRSATILGAPIGIYLWQKKAIKFPAMASAVFFLLLNAMIASRLSLLMATFVYLVITLRRNIFSRGTSNVGRRWVAAIAIGAVGFCVLAGLNFFRNAQYYEAAGVSNPFVMNLYQMGAYLATPAQVSLGVADAIMRGKWQQPSDPVDAINAVEPTFLQFNKISKGEGLKDADAYGYSVALEKNFTTNSVFADTYSVYGLWGLVYTALLYALAGYLLARLSSYGVAVAGTAGVMAYSLSEVWRTQIVNYGFVIFLLLLTLSCAFGAIVWARFDRGGLKSLNPL